MSNLPPSLPGQRIIVPFWQRLPAFIVFPLAPANLGALVLFAALSFAAALLPFADKHNYWLTQMLVGMLALRHGFRAMDKTAHGHIDAKAQARVIQIDRTRISLPWKMLPIFLGWIGILMGAAHWGGPALTVAKTAFLVLTPVMLMRLCASKKLRESLAPAGWLRYLRGMGAPYLLPCSLLLLVSLGMELAPDLMASIPGGKLTLPVLEFALLYLNLLMFHLMGYLMYQYNEALGLSAMIGFEENTTMASDESTIEAMISARLAAGQMDEAVALAKNAIRKEPDNLGAHERLYTLLITAGDRTGAQRQANRLFKVCIAQGRTQRALALYQELRSQSANMDLSGDEILPLAKAALKQSDPKLAVDLMRGFDRIYPGHTDIPEIYLLSAQVMSEHFHKKDLARGILQGLLQRYPAHELAPLARHHLDLLERESQ